MLSTICWFFLLGPHLGVASGPDLGPLGGPLDHTYTCFAPRASFFHRYFLTFSRLNMSPQPHKLQCPGDILLSVMILRHRNSHLQENVNTSLRRFKTYWKLLHKPERLWHGLIIETKDFMMWYCYQGSVYFSLDISGYIYFCLNEVWLIQHILQYLN